MNVQNFITKTSDAIDVTSDVAALKQVQYSNAMGDLVRELKILSSLPMLSPALKAKVDGALDKLSGLKDKIDLNLEKKED
jgi:hypothetical protein